MEDVDHVEEFREYFQREPASHAPTHDDFALKIEDIERLRDEVWAEKPRYTGWAGATPPSTDWSK